MGGRRKEYEERRSGTYRAVEGSIKEDEYGETGCLVRYPSEARESSPKVKIDSPCLWPLQLPVWSRQNTIDRRDAQNQIGTRENRKGLQVEEVGSGQLKVPDPLRLGVVHVRYRLA